MPHRSSPAERPLRVAMNLEQLLAPSPGGVGRYAAKLAAHLSELGCHVLPVVARHGAAEVTAAWSAWALDAVGPPRHLPLPRPLLYDAWHLLSWPGLVDQAHDADIIHAPSLAVPPKQGHPLVVSVHDAAPWRHPEAFTARGRWFHRAGLRAALARADVILTGTRAAAAELAERAGVPEERCRVIAYGVSPFSPPGEEVSARVMARHGLGERPYVLWVGSLEPRKGVGTLVKAMARLASGPSGPEWDLVLAGFAGWHNAGLISTEDQSTLGPSLHRVGRVSDDELAALYAGAGIFAFPSRHEGFGLPVLEAMAAGVPVIASDIPAVAEVAGGAAVLVAPEDVDGWAVALADLMASPEQRALRAQAGRERAASLSWRATAEATLEVYRQLVG